jgi:hypothetical protein
MGINIGLDIGSISLKLAALGRPADRGILEALCAGARPFRMVSAEPPLVLSDYRRIAGSPIQSTYDLLQEFYDTVPEARVEGIRVTGSGSRTIAKILGLYFENEFKAIARMVAAKARNTSGWISRASSITTAAASARQAPDRSSISRRCACATRSKKSGIWWRTQVAPRASPAAARCSPRAT